MFDFITPQKKYHTLDFYLKKTYQSKVFKVSLNGDFTCPNRDGTISRHGCIFCSEKGSGDFAGERGKPLTIQFNTIRNIIHHKWPNAKYIAYFQANTNTYGPIEKLKSLYEEAINLDPNIVILSIATRPDCLNDEVIEYLASLNQKIKVWVELGLQTINEQTQKFLNLGYSTKDLVNAVNRLRKYNIDCIAHIINGLPNETFDDMINTAKFLNTLDLQGVKIHSLYIQKNTILSKIYEQNPFKLLTLEEYVDIVVKQLCLLNPSFVIHRINGDPPRDELVAPEWVLKKFVIMNEIDKKMRVDNLYQGIYYK